VHWLYLEAYQQRISNVHATTRHKHNSLEKLWAYLDAEHPQIASAAQVRRTHLLAFVPYAISRAREVQRAAPRLPAGEDHGTAHQWLINVRCFFADICTWALEDGSPFAGLAPPAVPLERHDSSAWGSRRPAAASRNARSPRSWTSSGRSRGSGPLAARRWQDAQQVLADAPTARTAARGEADAFWDWALLELLLQSGIRIEEACELTTLDVLRRRHSDGRTYYLLHVKPSEFDRARVIPIGDGLGRVITQIITHVKAFYGTPEVPAATAGTAVRNRPARTRPTCSRAPGTPARSPTARSAAGSLGSPGRPGPGAATAALWSCGRTTAGGCSPLSI
jgi:integrase